MPKRRLARKTIDYIRAARKKGERALPSISHRNFSVHKEAQKRAKKTGQKHYVFLKNAKSSNSVSYPVVLEAREQLPKKQFDLIGIIENKETGKKRFFHVPKRKLRTELF